MEPDCLCMRAGLQCGGRPGGGVFYNQFILGQPQELAGILAKWSTAATFVNAVVSVVLVGIIYNALRPVLLRSGILIPNKSKRHKAA